jgi:hypothetical protein
MRMSYCKRMPSSAASFEKIKARVPVQDILEVTRTIHYATPLEVKS